MNEDKLKILNLFNSPDKVNHYLAWELCKLYDITLPDIIRFILNYGKCTFNEVYLWYSNEFKGIRGHLINKLFGLNIIFEITRHVGPSSEWIPKIIVYHDLIGSCVIYEFKNDYPVTCIMENFEDKIMLVINGR